VHSVHLAAHLRAAKGERVKERGQGVVAIVLFTGALLFALAGCGSSSKGAAAPGPSNDPLAPFQGTWVNCAGVGSGTSARSSLAITGGAFTSTITQHPSADCSGTADPVFSDSGTVSARAAVDASFGGTTVKAVPLDVVSRTNGPFYDLGYVDAAPNPNVLYLGDSSGANDGTTPEKRPTSLDTATPLRRQ
jgi:hypothetical protein